MKRRTFLIIAATAALLLASCSRGHQAATPDALGLRQIADVPLPGSTSRWDYASLDPSTGRLYIAHLGGSSVTVFDTKSQQVVTDITGIASAHGVIAVPQLKRVYATATGDNQVVTIDAQTLQILARTDGGNYPDGLAYDPDDGKVFVSDESGGTVTVVSTETNRRTATIDLGGEVGNTQYDTVGKRIFSVVQTRNQLVAIDPVTNQVTSRSDLPGCKHAHGLALDDANRLAFIACDENATLVIFDLRTMQITGTQTVGDMPDVLAFDDGLHRLYVAAESGVLAIFDEHGTTLTKVGQGMIAPRAHVIAVDAATHRIYLPLEESGGHPALRILEPATGTHSP
jgi:YVTN family beta-propeller protein